MSQRFTRNAQTPDAPAIAHIYNQGMEDRTATFETTPRTASDILAWLEQDYPVCVAGEDGVVLAYAAAFPYRSRPCYDGVREFSIYVSRAHRGSGFGRDALLALITEAKARGWHKLVSRIFPQNTASLALCASLGFREVGTYEKHGQLDGRWMDTVIVEKLLI